MYEHGGPYISEGHFFQVSLRESSVQKRKSLSLFFASGMEASLLPIHFAEGRELFKLDRKVQKSTVP